MNNQLTQEELEKFNTELKALLIKYDVNLTVGQIIQVVKNQAQPTVVVNDDNFEVKKEEDK